MSDIYLCDAFEIVLHIRRRIHRDRSFVKVSKRSNCSNNNHSTSIGSSNGNSNDL